MEPQAGIEVGTENSNRFSVKPGRLGINRLERLIVLESSYWRRFALGLRAGCKL